MTIITYHAVMANKDTNEGRGESFEALRFTKEADARKINNDSNFIRIYGIMEMPYQNNIVPRTIHIYDSADEYLAKFDEEQMRQRALSKLTPQECKLLGV